MHNKTLNDWVQQHCRPDGIQPITGDASFRRYFRIFCDSGSLIAVDAPPDHENNEAFVAIAKRFLKEKLSVPEVIATDFAAGFLLLSDLGDRQLLTILNADNVENYYREAIKNLAKIQKCHDMDSWELPHYNEQLLLQELNRFHEWYLLKHLSLQLFSQEFELLEKTYQLLITSARNQPQVCVHRDYHSRNLMVLEDNTLGILDFQDAVIGPITYDLVSLLKDCYIEWPSDKVAEWVAEFWLNNLTQEQKNTISLAEFTRYFDWMGLQRHLKVLGIFARLSHRDQKASYLKDTPRILGYVYRVCQRYSELRDFLKFLEERVFPHESYDISSRAR